MDQSLAFAIQNNLDIVWDQTNTSAKKRKAILAKIPKSYKKICRCILPPNNPSEWLELDKRLNSRPGKTIPNHIIKSMCDIFTEPELDEGFDYIEIVDMFGNKIKEKS